MKLAELERKLLLAARANPPGDQVPHAFEKRVLARVAERRVGDVAALWARALWRAAASCVAVVVLLGAWSVLSPASQRRDLAQQLDRTVLAAVDQEGLN